jgi:DNA primase
MAKKEQQPEEATPPAKKAPKERKPKAEPMDKAIEKFEKQAYSLPRGCNEADVLNDIKRYQCFEFERAVYVMRDKWYAVQASNFTCTIHQHIVDQEQPLKLITIANIDFESWTYEVRSEDFLTLMGFKKATTARGNFQWTGTEKDYQLYLCRMMDLMGKGRIILELGWQPEGFFACCNAAINGSVIHYDKHGCFKVGTEQFYVPSGNIIYRRDENKHINAKRVELVEGVDFATIAEQLQVVHREHSMTAITFQLATLFSDYIFSRTKGFPLLFLYGAAGSGKDQLIQACQTICGTPQPEIILSGPSTDKGQMRMLAEFVNLSLNLAEFKGGMRKEQFEFLKAIWGRIPYRRGNIIGRFTTDSVPIRSTVFVSGNDYPNQDDALMTRIIVEEMHKDKFTAEEREEFVKLKRMVEKGYSAIMADVLKHRKEFETSWYDEHYLRAQLILDEALRDRHIDGRMQTNLAILLGTFLFFEEKLKFPFGRDQFIQHLVALICKQQEKRQSGSEVSNFWTCFIYAVRKHQLKEGTNFVAEEERLYFYWDEVHAQYLQTHREVFGEPGKASATMKGKLEHHACWIGPLASKRIGKRKTSAYVFDMEKSGTDLRNLLTESTELAEKVF